MDLPYSDGIPLDDVWHRPAIAILIDSLRSHWRDRPDYYVGGNEFLYFCSEPVFTHSFRGPDFFVVKGVESTRTRHAWVSWHEGGRLPNVIIELVSESSAHQDQVEKKRFYAERFRTPEYFLYNRFDDLWTGYRLDGSRYDQPLPLENGRIWSRELELYVGTWTGAYERLVGRWPRFFSRIDDVVPTFAEAEKQRADAMAQEITRLKAELERLKNSNPEAK